MKAYRARKQNEGLRPSHDLATTRRLIKKIMLEIWRDALKHKYVLVSQPEADEHIGKPLLEAYLTCKCSKIIKKIYNKEDWIR